MIKKDVDNETEVFTSEIRSEGEREKMERREKWVVGCPFLKIAARRFLIRRLNFGCGFWERVVTDFERQSQEQGLARGSGAGMSSLFCWVGEEIALMASFPYHRSKYFLWGKFEPGLS